MLQGIRLPHSPIYCVLGLTLGLHVRFWIFRFKFSGYPEASIVASEIHTHTHTHTPPPPSSHSHWKTLTPNFSKKKIKKLLSIEDPLVALSHF